MALRLDPQLELRHSVRQVLFFPSQLPLLSTACIPSCHVCPSSKAPAPGHRVERYVTLKIIQGSSGFSDWFQHAVMSANPARPRDPLKGGESHPIHLTPAHPPGCRKDGTEAQELTGSAGRAGDFGSANWEAGKAFRVWNLDVRSSAAQGQREPGTLRLPSPIQSPHTPCVPRDEAVSRTCGPRAACSTRLPRCPGAALKVGARR